jgi:hypothetical protein
MAKKLRKAPSDGYEQIWSGHWWTFDQDFDLACCHCNLVHGVKMRLNAGRIEVQMVENQKATKRLRKLHGIAVIKKE